MGTRLQLFLQYLRVRVTSPDYLFYLFIYKFVKRPGSLTEQAPLRGPEKKKEKKKRKLEIQMLTKMTTL